MASLSLGKKILCAFRISLVKKDEFPRWLGNTPSLQGAIITVSKYKFYEYDINFFSKSFKKELLSLNPP